MQSWISRLALTLAITCQLSAGIAQENALTDLQSIRKVAPAEISNQAVDFEATVTHVDSLKAFLFAQEESDAIFVFRPDVTQIKPGKRVRIRGRLAKGDRLPIVVEPKITVLGDDKLPTPRNLAALSEFDDCQYISCEFDILQTLVSAEATQLFAKTENDENVFIQVEHPMGEAISNVAHIAGSRVRCTGILGLQLHMGAFDVPGREANQLVGYRLLCNSPNDIEVIENDLTDSNPPEAVGLSAIVKPNFPNGRFLTFAQISLVDYLETPEVVVTDGSIAMRFTLHSVLDIIPGMIVRMGGTKSNDKDGQPQFELDYITNLNLATFQRSEPTSVKRAIETYAPDHRITVEGKPIRVEKRSGRPHLILAEGTETVAVHFQNDALESLASVKPSIAQKVSITGVSRPEKAPYGSAFQLVVASSKDVAIVEAKPSLSRLVPAVLGALVLLCASAALWIKLLKTQVTQKTNQAREISAQLRSAYDAIDDGLLAFDQNMNALAVNGAFRQIMQLDVHVNDSVIDLPDKLQSRLHNAEEFGQEWTEWLRHPQARGAVALATKGRESTYIHVDSTPIRGDDGTPVGRILIARDETEKKTLQAELLHSNKLEAVGRLVAGIAHDFNNVLTAITANLSIARIDGETTVAAVEEQLAIAEDAAFRGAEIVRRLLTFSTKAQFDLQPYSVNEIIERLGDLARHTFDASVRFEYELDSGDPFVNVEATAIEQVLLNLYVNAKDAMPNGGVIKVSTKVAKQSQTDQDSVVISVKDNGAGVEKEIRDRLFEPYFTTKDSDHGTGLGLSVSYRVVQQHGGLLRYQNRPTGGSEFQILLPLETSRKSSSVPEKERLLHGSGTVLVVDDEDAVRNVAQSILRRQGYITIAARNGEEAIALVSKNTELIDAVLLDLTMPGMSGRDVLKVLRKNWPNIPVIICSGYLIDEAARIGDPEGPDEIVAKPYSMSDLASAVANATKTTRRRSA